MRKIKFRFWSNHLNRFVVPNDNIFVGALKDPDMNPMQFTGVLDQNGVEIYEGDIVRGYNYKKNPGRPREVVWSSNGYTATGLSLWALNGCEVIGNVHENPELLNKEK